MFRVRSLALLAAFAAAPLLASACGPGPEAVVTPEAAAADAGFAELQARGEIGMGVDQYESTHRFDALEDGGRIELQYDSDDPEAVATIRSHLKAIEGAFSEGDFSIPHFVHAHDDVPGTDVMAARHDRIEYSFRELPRGGELRLVTTDPEALAAIHEFMAFQRQDHRAGGMDHGAMDHGAMDHGGMDHAHGDHQGMDHDGLDRHGLHHQGMDHHGLDRHGLHHEGMDHGGRHAPGHGRMGTMGGTMGGMHGSARTLGHGSPPGGGTP